MKKGKKQENADIALEILDPISVADYTNNYYMDYSLYVIQSRAIPNYIDGLKVVQRKLIYAALQQASNKKTKVAELGGSLSSCFSGNTEITVNDKVICIGDYYDKWSKDDTVLAFDEHNKKMNANVCDVIKKSEQDIYLIELEDGKVLEVTDDHLIMTKDRSWQKVRDLLESDEVLIFEGINGFI